MLPFVVVVLAVVYLVLHYTGAFDEIAERSRRGGKGREPGSKDEGNRRLMVFEEFFKGGPDRDEGEE